jgi:Spherulation-specific family 4
MATLLKPGTLAVLTIALVIGAAARALIPLSAALAVVEPAPSVKFHTTGVLVPLYVYPGKVWDEAIAVKYAHDRVPMAIVANVDNGPGSTPIAAYLNYVQKAQKAGIDVLGYVSTKYAKRSQETVEAEMLRWYDLYHTDGIFLDEMANDAPYYQALTDYGHAHSLWFIMGNPGTNVPGNSGPDVINFYEQSGYPSPALLKSSGLRTYGKARWSYIADAVGLNRDRVVLSTSYVGYLYATDGKQPECYCRLPSYFSTLTAVLANH